MVPTDINLIANGVIILFIMDIDETFYKFLQNNVLSWVDKVTQGKEEEGEPRNMVKKVPKDVKKKRKKKKKEEKKKKVYHSTLTGMVSFSGWRK